MNVTNNHHAMAAIDDLAHFYLENEEIERAMYLFELLKSLDALPDRSISKLGLCYSHFEKVEELAELITTISDHIVYERMRAVIDVLCGNFADGHNRFKKTLKQQPSVFKNSRGKI